MAERHRTGIRVRTTVGAVVVVAAALAVGAAGLVFGLRRTLTDEMRSLAELRADDLASALAEGTPASELALDAGEDVLAQVLTDDGRVLVASRALVEASTPMASVAPGTSAIVRDVAIFDVDEAALDRPTEQEREDFVVAARAVPAPSDGRVVLAGRALDTATSSASTVAGLLALGAPVLLVVLGAITWVVVGRALAPVETMRRTVDSITAADLDRRVAEPPTHDEVARLARTLNSMLERLQEARDRQQRFVADASHELRSPVAAIRQASEVAAAHPETTSVPELAGDVAVESRRLERLIGDLLLLARADEAHLIDRAHEVDIDDIALAEARRLREAGSISVDSAGIGAARVHGDARLLALAARNLGDNAARHASSTVAIAVVQNGQQAVLSVDDDGPGVPDSDRTRVLERFVRLDAARARDDGGSGLGLAIVAEIARAHRGTVRVLASRLGGARVELSLPLATTPSSSA